MNFERPLGLALSGGAAHGAWQAGALRALSDGGLTFDRVVGFSAGALTGAAYAMDLQDVLAERWRNVDRERVLVFSPKLRPLSLFSNTPIWEAVRYIGDEENALRRLRCVLVVCTVRVPQFAYHYARFTPQGADGWDGPLATKLVASCSIPLVFPPVQTPVAGNSAQRLVDGGIPALEGMRFDALAGCRTVIALQMTRLEEVGLFKLWPWLRFDQTARDACYRRMASGIDSWVKRTEAPAVYRLLPSRILDYAQLAFRADVCVPAMEKGAADARGFLSDPEPFRVQAPAVAPPPETLVPSSRSAPGPASSGERESPPTESGASPGARR